jgi:hypothetical protein
MTNPILDPESAAAAAPPNGTAPRNRQKLPLFR